MQKTLSILFVAGCLAAFSLPSSAEARDLSSLLGARAQLAAKATPPAIDGERAFQRPSRDGSLDDFRSLDTARHRTPRFPLLRRLIRFYLLWVVKPLDIWPVFPGIWD